MTELIIALARAHSALIKNIKAGGDEKALSSTARKIEATLVASLRQADATSFSRTKSAIINSGSLKALKAIPVSKDPVTPGYMDNGPDVKFIIDQSPAYLREAQKRGFTINEGKRTDILKSMADPSGPAISSGRETLVLDGPVNAWMMSNTVKLVLELPADGAARIAPIAAKLLKAGNKADPKAVQNDIDVMFCIHNPAAAHRLLFRSIALYALLGAKAPAKDAIEHDEMTRLSTELFSQAGCKKLREETGGLEAFLAGGHLSPPAIIKEFEQKTLRFRAP